MIETYSFLDKYFISVSAFLYITTNISSVSYSGQVALVFI